jgi:DNA-binding transcriptional LysR family regulator
MRHRARPDIDTRRLRFFVEVVRQGGFSQAANVVFASQSTVSKAVKQLETDLDVPLLNRIRHRSELTAAGQIVYAKALRLLAEGDDLLAQLDGLRGLETGGLRLGFPRASSGSLFASMYASFRREHPGVEIEAVVQDCERLQAMLRAGEVDLAALVQPIAEEFDWQEVRTDPLMVLLPSDHALARCQRVKLSKLRGLPVILLDDDGMGINEPVLGAFRDAGIEPTIAASSGQTDFIFELVAAGAGIAFLPRPQAQIRTHRRVRSVLLDDPACRWSISLAWVRGSCLSHAARTWLAHARDAERGRPGASGPMGGAEAAAAAACR